jgi:hypothetical protein
VQGLRVASLAGEVSQRKIVATRIGNKIMNELKVTGQLQNSGQTGVVKQGGLQYNWSVRSQIWTEDMTTHMNQVILTVTYVAQGKNYDVSLSTLIPQATTL